MLLWADISTFPDPLHDVNITKCLSSEHINKINNFKLLQKRKQSLCSMLMKNYVAHKYGKSVFDITLGINGKPMLDGVCFNISHSRDLVICAVNESDVGCDVEYIKKVPNNVSKRYFNSVKDDRTFFKLWTANESYLKMTGEGLRGGLDKISCDFMRLQCFFNEIEIKGYENYCIFVCTQKNDFNNELVDFGSLL